MEDRRKKPAPSHTEEYLQQLPALALLTRLPIAMLGIGIEGDVAFANPACAEMLGYFADAPAMPRGLPTLMRGRESTTPTECMDELRTTTSVIEWNHREGYAVRTKPSAPLLLRATDVLLLIGLTDVTETLWAQKRF